MQALPPLPSLCRSKTRAIWDFNLPGRHATLFELHLFTVFARPRHQIPFEKGTPSAQQVCAAATLLVCRSRSWDQHIFSAPARLRCALYGAWAGLLTTRPATARGPTAVASLFASLLIDQVTRLTRCSPRSACGVWVICFMGLDRQHPSLSIQAVLTA